MAETPPSNAASRPPRLGWRLLRRLLGLLLLLAMPLGLVAWLFGTTQGAIALLKIRIHVAAIFGLWTQPGTDG